MPKPCSVPGGPRAGVSGCVAAAAVLAGGAEVAGCATAEPVAHGSIASVTLAASVAVQNCSRIRISAPHSHRRRVTLDSASLKQDVPSASRLGRLGVRLV